MNGPERKWKRYKVDIRLRIRDWDNAEGAVSVVRSYELSEGGMSVYVSEALEVGTNVLTEFSLRDSSEPLRVKAVVRNQRGFRCGLEFVELPLAARLEIARYLGTFDVIEI